MFFFYFVIVEFEIDWEGLWELGVVIFLRGADFDFEIFDKMGLPRS